MKEPATEPIGLARETEARLHAARTRSAFGRLVTGLALVVGYVAVAGFRAPLTTFWLALALYGGLHQFAIEEVPDARVPEEYRWSAFLALVTAALAWVAHVAPAGSALGGVAAREWFPVGLIAIALAFDRRILKPSAAEGIGAAFANARRSRRGRD
jgi:hypothetical protein